MPNKNTRARYAILKKQVRNNQNPQKPQPKVRATKHVTQASTPSKRKRQKTITNVCQLVVSPPHQNKRLINGYETP